MMSIDSQRYMRSLLGSLPLAALLAISACGGIESEQSTAEVRRPTGSAPATKTDPNTPVSWGKLCSKPKFQGTCVALKTSLPFADQLNGYQSLAVYSAEGIRLCRYYGYQNCDTYAKGNYPSLKNAPNNVAPIRSVELGPKDAVALVCQKKFLQPPCKYLYTTQMRLDNTYWQKGSSSLNNSIKSLMVRPDHSLFLSNGYRLQLKTKQTWTGWKNLPAAHSEKVSSIEIETGGRKNVMHVCSETYFKGECTSLSTKSMPLLRTHFHSGLALNDTIASLMLEPGYRVTFGQHAGFGGASGTFKSSNSKSLVLLSLSGILGGALEDDLSAIEVFPSNKKGGDIHVCQKPGLYGLCKALTLGTYPSLEEITFDDGSPLKGHIGSMAIRSGKQAISCQFKGYGGSCTTRTESGNWWKNVGSLPENQVASIEVQKKGAALSKLHYCKNVELNGPCAASNTSVLNLSKTWSDGSWMNDSISSIAVAPGYRASLYEHGDFGGEVRILDAYAPGHDWVDLYGFTNFDDKTSTIDLTKNINLWTNSSWKPSHPKNREVFWAEEAQGIAHDDNNWYLTNRQTIAKYGKGLNIADKWVYATAGLPDGCDHIGDPDSYDGKLYVPVEGCGGSSNSRIYVYDENLNVLKWGGTPGGASWVAVNPVNKLMYTSKDFDTDTVQVYSTDFTNQQPMTVLYEIKLSSFYNNMQGAAFSKNGTFYIVTDDRWDQSNAGIHVFQLQGAKGIHQRHIATGEYDACYGFDSLDCTYRKEELQGITIAEVQNGESPNIAESQIHMVFMENEAGDTDDVWVYHFSVSGGEL